MSKFLDLVNEFARSVSVTPTAPTGNLMSLFTKLCDTLQVDCEQTDGGLLIKIPAEEENEAYIQKQVDPNRVINQVDGVARQPVGGVFGLGGDNIVKDAKRVMARRNKVLIPRLIKYVDKLTTDTENELNKLTQLT